jgi:uncharacterized protein
LTDAELDQLGDILASLSGDAMSLEELDGFFAALIAGPENVMPSAYYPEVFGGEYAFADLAQAQAAFGLLMRHWNTIAGTLYAGEVHVPLLLEDEKGVAHGNDWATGFMRGMDMRHDGWATLVNDEEHGGCLIPMMALCHEHDEDPAMRPEPIKPEQREKLVAGMAAGLVAAYRYFRSRPKTQPAPERRRKIGRNEVCPCGSGKKYKKCCGSMTVN